MLLLLTKRKATCQHKGMKQQQESIFRGCGPHVPVCTQPNPCRGQDARKKTKFSSDILLVSKGKRGKPEKSQSLLWCNGALKSILMQFKARGWGRASSHLISAERWHRAFQGFPYKHTMVPLLTYSWATWDLIGIFHKLLLRETAVENQRQ